MFCKNCGKEIPDTAKYCPECGANQIEDTIVSNTSNTTLNNSESSLNPERSNFALLGFILGIISVFIGFKGILPIAAIILSIIGINECDKEHRPGKNFAIWGIVFAVGAILIRLIFTMFIFSQFGEIFDYIFYAIEHACY